MIRINGGQATLGANTFTGAQVAPSLALGGATIGSDALAVTGTSAFSSTITTANITNGSSNWIGWSSRSLMRSPSDGVMKLSNFAETDFSRLQFGGTTSSFPSIKRNAAALNFRLADDSADAPITAGAGTFTGDVAMTQNTSSTGSLVITNTGVNGGNLRLTGDGATTPSKTIRVSGGILQILNNAYSAAIFSLGDTGTLTTSTINSSSSIRAYTSSAPPAGGTTSAGYLISSTTNFGIFFGSGAPTLSAAKGSLYMRSDGTGVADRMYVNTDASTTWTAVATVA